MMGFKVVKVGGRGGGGKGGEEGRGGRLSSLLPRAPFCFTGHRLLLFLTRTLLFFVDPFHPVCCALLMSSSFRFIVLVSLLCIICHTLSMM